MFKKQTQFENQFDDQLYGRVPSTYITQIISNFKFLLPYKTTKEEIQVLQYAKCEILNLETFTISEKKVYGIYFSLHEPYFESVKNKIPDIEKSIKGKAEAVFKWFPESMVLEVKIIKITKP